MKIISLVMAAAFFVASCSSCSVTTSSLKDEHITTAAFVEQCIRPSEVHDIQAFSFPIRAQVVRHQNCLGVDDLLVISWPGELSPKHKTAARLLMLMYLEHHAGELEAELLKTDMGKQDGHMIGSAFYKLTKKVEKKTE